VAHLKYLSYVLRHKWFVFVECCKLGLPLQGLFHDISKLTPQEWSPYVNHFYGKKPSPRDKTGAYNPLHVGEDFDYAWLSHQHHNKHHWQYWILRGDAGWTKTMPMPDRYRKEMLADWRGAGRAIKGKDDTAGWYRANKEKMELHPDTRAWIEKQLGVI
jgi:hypothetical protein